MISYFQTLGLTNPQELVLLGEVLNYHLDYQNPRGEVLYIKCKINYITISFNI